MPGVSAQSASAVGAWTPPSDGDIRLVAMDLDGTILERGRSLAPALVAVLRTLARRGVRCATATGRPLPFQLELFERHDLGTAAGTPAALMVDEREIFLLAGTAADGAAAATGGPAMGGYQPLGAWNSAVRRRWQALHGRAMDWLEQARGEANRQGWQPWRHLSDDDAAARGLPTLEFDYPDQAAAISDWLAGGLAAQAPELACNRNVRLLQVHDAQVGKGLVLAELARHWGFAPRQVLAIGDSLNDASMLDGRLGFQVATVGNADERISSMVRQAGGYVAAESLGDGVIEILRAYHVGGLADGEGRGIP
jgi:hydroxymethylpyrimidine pyrophosphatase-like HAD family hydrolase